MSKYEIRECRISDLRELARTMRAQDRAEIERAGLVVRHTLFRLWRVSVEPRCALVDGEVAACWGDEAGLISSIGRMWLFTAPPVARLPLAFFRETRAEIAHRLETRHELWSSIAEGYDAATRFFALLGFDVMEPVAALGARYRPMRITRREGMG